jgi:hypothetical protein
MVVFMTINGKEWVEPIDTRTYGEIVVHTYGAAKTG